ncbi:MAG: amidohydrolase family protein, partial [Cyanobacteriota bacterium]|nr:amidohydrolase family protein [Cyanobacteriota bacterium]
EFYGQIVCGHCCSLATQSPKQVQETIALVKQAGIGIISLPMCNLYLQDRQYQQQLTQTPRWRGITLLHELKNAGVPVAIASDNCRDPFYNFGDHDGLEVFKMAVRVGHLDHPFGDWPQAVTRTPGELMRLPTAGKIGVGFPADLIIFPGRSFSEILSRSQHNRIVLRQGKEIDTTLPDYQELDDLI